MKDSPKAAVATRATATAKGAVPLDVQSATLTTVTHEVRGSIERAKRSWLKNDEVFDILSRHHLHGLKSSSKPPATPPGGSLFLFNRNTVRYFRKDGHDWRKKLDGKSVRETHEKLKVQGSIALNCYYAHSVDDNLQRRSYWLLDGDEGLVLVHYLATSSTRGSKRLAHLLNAVNNPPASAMPLPPMSVTMRPVPKPCQVGPSGPPQPDPTKLPAAVRVKSTSVVPRAPIRGSGLSTGSETGSPASTATAMTGPWQRMESFLAHGGAQQAIKQHPAERNAGSISPSTSDHQESTVYEQITANALRSQFMTEGHMLTRLSSNTSCNYARPPVGMGEGTKNEHHMESEDPFQVFDTMLNTPQEFEFPQYSASQAGPGSHHLASSHQHQHPHQHHSMQGLPLRNMQEQYYNMQTPVRQQPVSAAAQLQRWTQDTLSNGHAYRAPAPYANGMHGMQQQYPLPGVHNPYMGQLPQRSANDMSLMAAYGLAEEFRMH